MSFLKLPYCRRAALAGSYSHALVHRKDEDLSVADVSRARAFDDRLDRLVDEVVVHRDCKAHLLVERDFLYGASVQVEVSALLSAAKCICDGHLVYLAGEQRLLDGIQSLGLNVGYDQFHLSFLAPRPSQRRAPFSKHRANA